MNWSLIEDIGELTVKNAGYLATFKATTIGSGNIQIEDNGIIKKISLTVVAPTDTAPPETTDISGVQILKNQENVLSLSYTDIDENLAESCSVDGLSNVVISTPCSCDVLGNCSVGITGTTDYTGLAEFNYTVTTNNQTSNSSLVSVNIVVDCPSNYIPVYGNTTLGTDDFCIMTYEASNDGSGGPISDSSRVPWTNITAEDAYNYCDTIVDLTYSTGEFALISNPEWMTIARDIEINPLNWSSGIVGTGCVFNGNYGTDDTCGYDGSNPEFGDDRNEKAMLRLSTNSSIWDFSGNVWEIVDWVAGDGSFTRAPSNANNSWMQVTTTSGSITANDLSPLGSYNSSHGMGKWFGSYDTDRGYTVRGSDYDDISSAPGTGIYSMALNNTSTVVENHIGFRCVYRP